MQRVLVIDDNHDMRDLMRVMLVLVVSGGGSRIKGTGYLATAREIGAHAVLAKPFEQQDLVRAVRALL